MNKFDLELYKKEKEEYDKKIRSLDYKIVETYVNLYNAKSNNSNHNKDDNNGIVNELQNKIYMYELEKKNVTKEIWDKVVAIKEGLREIINNKVSENLIEKENYLIAIFTINKITDLYFDINDLIGLSYLLDDVKSQKKNEQVENKIGVNIFENRYNNLNNVQSFNIEEQRIVDFENLLNHIEQATINYRTDIERAVSRFIINYNVVKNTQYLQKDFDNITNNYLQVFKEVILKFKKDESIDALQERINKQNEQIKELDKKILNNYIEMKDAQRKMQELAKIYFVGNYVKKLEEQIASEQVEQEVNSEYDVNINDNFANIDNAENDVFKRIKQLSYNKRMNHIIEVSKWTKNLEEKIRDFNFEETDFQFVIYLIRQTENVCNTNFEQIANLIINLCDTNIQLEVVERNENNKNKKLCNELKITQILNNGIDNIKKKYSKIPFIGRKVSSILNVKMLNK